ncbi:MAG: YbaB/EbfC family nucleoid-associated protein [Bacilli bacterium]|jgi:DNA-binding YbaB/EbfC family protein
MASMQQLMAQAQKMKREMQKAQDALKIKEFSITKSGGVTVAMLGSKEVVEVSINEDLFEKENKEMVETLLIMAINECIEKINAEEAAINEAITGSASGLF